MNYHRTVCHISLSDNICHISNIRYQISNIVYHTESNIIKQIPNIIKHVVETYQIYSNYHTTCHKQILNIVRVCVIHKK